MYSFSKSVIESLEKNQGEELFNKKQGIEIKGELLIPKERKRIEVELTLPRYCEICQYLYIPTYSLKGSFVL